MNIIIHATKSRKMHFNNKLLLTIVKLNLNNDFFCIENTKINTLEESVINLEKREQIKTIIILLDSYDTFVHDNINFITEKKNIKFYIHVCDMHFKSRRPDYNKRCSEIYSILHNHDHIYIFSYYWYHFICKYNIKKENLISFPLFVDVDYKINFNTNVINKILISGEINGWYPIRQYLVSLNNKNIDVLSIVDNIREEAYLNYLNNYLCCFTCCASKDTPYIVGKFFEIPFTGSLLLAYDEYVKEPLKELGFIDEINYISCTKNNIIEKIEWICDEKNIDKINEIRLNGYNFVRKYHTNHNRFELLKKLCK
jgi:hypothetical protein